MGSRESILQAVRAKQLPDKPAPSLEQNWIRYEDRRAQFAAALQSVGGRCEFVADGAAAAATLAEHAEWPAAKKIVSLVSGVAAGNVDLAMIDDPHRLEDVDFAILRGSIAVAENGAVWVTDQGLKHRAVYFIAQHLVLVVPAGAIVDNMAQAYEKLQFAGPGYGAFLSGPSKTADIEQSLVIGAHGPRSMTVLLVESM
jgi:L-lactate dehydrogenase complex protein LldG